MFIAVLFVIIKITHMSIKKRMDKQTVAYLYNGMLLISKTECTIIDTGSTCMNLKIIMLSKRSQTKRSNVWFYLYQILGNAN